jgi:acetate kinase
LESKGNKQTSLLDFTSVKEGLHHMLEKLWDGPFAVMEKEEALSCIGHRVVHGGARFIEPTRINPSVKEGIRQVIPLAPLHNPANLEGIELMESFFPDVPQVAVFDTAFHSTLPEQVKTYPLPLGWRQKGIQKYGFHGISHQYCAGRATELLPKASRLINCHLGNGASLCALLNGKSIDTTMGMTPLEGLMMGTRCGSIDPGLIFYLLREHHMSPQELDYLLNFESGLKGIGGHSDMRDLMGRGDEQAALAIEMYVYRLKAFIGAFASSLGGVDALIFTAGIGENSAEIRHKACEGLGYLGIKLDEAKNKNCRPDMDIATSDSPCRVLVIHTQEEWMIAKNCFIN